MLGLIKRMCNYPSTKLKLRCRPHAVTLSLMPYACHRHRVKLHCVYRCCSLHAGRLPHLHLDTFCQPFCDMMQLCISPLGESLATPASHLVANGEPSQPSTFIDYRQWVPEVCEARASALCGTCSVSLQC
jgi:hypothetical protein